MSTTPLLLIFDHVKIPANSLHKTAHELSIHLHAHDENGTPTIKPKTLRTKLKDGEHCWEDSFELETNEASTVRFSFYDGDSVLGRVEVAIEKLLQHSNPLEFHLDGKTTGFCDIGCQRKKKVKSSSVARAKSMNLSKRKASEASGKDWRPTSPKTPHTDRSPEKKEVIFSKSDDPLVIPPIAIAGQTNKHGEKAEAQATAMSTRSPRDRRPDGERLAEQRKKKKAENPGDEAHQLEMQKLKSAVEAKQAHLDTMLDLITKIKRENDELVTKGKEQQQGGKPPEAPWVKEKASLTAEIKRLEASKEKLFTVAAPPQSPLQQEVNNLRAEAAQVESRVAIAKREGRLAALQQFESRVKSCEDQVLDVQKYSQEKYEEELKEIYQDMHQREKHFATLCQDQTKAKATLSAQQQKLKLVLSCLEKGGSTDELQAILSAEEPVNGVSNICFGNPVLWASDKPVRIVDSRTI